MRPEDPRYRALPLSEAPEMDAKLAFVVSGWGVLFPLERYKLAKAAGRPDLTINHDKFFGDEATQLEATPALIIEQGEKVYLPPAMVFQGTKDEWTTVELAQRFAADYRGAGGTLDLQLLEGERHTFVNEHPFAPNSVKAVEMPIAFIKKYGSSRQAQR
jgi:alpha-beta hydrolase superfamily lysophospholipase